MRYTLLSLAMLLAAGCPSADDTPTDDADTDTDTVDPCDACDANATCEDAGTEDATCVCDGGYEGDGQTCADVDECATDNGGCDDNATCTNTEGAFSCACNTAWSGDGFTCEAVVDDDLRGCAIQQAEHPGYTNIPRDVALCGGAYDETNLTTACHTGWHVCLESEWLSRYPTNRPYKTSPTDPDLIGPTLGPLTSWGTSQADRCDSGVWIPNAPVDSVPYDDSVCHDPDDTWDNAEGADYLPYNDGKFLFDDDGSTVLQGKNAQGEFDCCSWDVTFAVPPGNPSEYAVYCCRD